MAKQPATKVLASGTWGTVECVVLKSGKIPAEEFLDDLEQVKASKSNGKVKFAVLFQAMANTGRVQPKRFKSEMDGLSAFRHEIGNVQYRFPCFRDGNKWIVTHGFKKPGAKKGLGNWPQAEEERAKKIRDEYFMSRKSNGKLDG